MKKYINVLCLIFLNSFLKSKASRHPLCTNTIQGGCSTTQESHNEIKVTLFIFYAKLGLVSPLSH